MKTFLAQLWLVLVGLLFLTLVVKACIVFPVARILVAAGVVFYLTALAADELGWFDNAL
jgi:hypothetical protein